jgi:hypothetical protein
MAGETPTVNYGWLKPVPGGSTSTWGNTLNATFDSIDDQVFKNAHPASLTVSSTPGTSTPGTVTFANSSASQKVRWIWALDTAPEGGGDAGSNFSLQAYHDLGGVAFTPLSFVRATGAATFGNALTVTGAATFAGAATFNGAVTFAGGAAGVTDGSVAAAGQVGEIISATVAAPGTALSSGVVTNLISIALTAGDWDVQAEVWFTYNASGAGSSVQASVSTVSVTIPSTPGPGVSRAVLYGPFAAGNLPIVAVKPCRINVATTTTVYLVVAAGLTAGGVNGAGNIWARRAR